MHTSLRGTIQYVKKIHFAKCIKVIYVTTVVRLKQWCPTTFFSVDTNVATYALLSPLCIINCKT